MKILYLCSNKFDYLQDLTYSGLVKLLGKDNVVDYPWNAKFHIPVKSYPKNLGFSGLSFRFPVTDFSKFDVVVLASAKKDVLSVYNSILPKIINKPIVFIDGGDHENIGGDFYLHGVGDIYEAVIKRRPFDIIFKREYITALHEKHSNVYPFPFSFPHDLHIPSVPETDKKYEVAFWAQQKPQVRENALRLLEGKYDCVKNGTTLNQDFSTYKRRGKFYLEELAECKIVLNFRGGGWDTMRYWEAPGVHSFMISQQPQITIPHNFVDGEQVVWCSDSLDDLLEKIDYYLLHQTEREAMAKKAYEHLIKYHLNTVRAQTLLTIVQQYLSTVK
jgi:glycosyl transferase family 1